MSGSDKALIDDGVIERLQAKTRRYDVAIDNELVIAVLPNGTKAWTWIHTGPGQPRRQTLGVYPAMSLAEARAAAAEATASGRREDEASATPYVIRDGRIEPAVAAVEWRWPLTAGVLVLIAGAAIGWFLLTLPDAREPEPRRAAPVAEAMTLDTTLESIAAPTPPGIAAARRSEPEGDAHDGEAPMAADGLADSGMAPEPEAGEPAAAAIVGSETLARSGAVDTLATRAAADGSETPARSGAADTLPTTDASAAKAATDPDGARPSAAGRSTADAQAVPDPTSPAPAPDPVAPIAGPDGKPNDARAGDAPGPAPAERPAATGSRVSDAADAALIDGDPRVARAALTTAVIEREPVDALGPVVTGDGSELQRLYFFTELRQLQGQRVRHRWIAGDRIQAEVPFEVGGAWRWRVYSSKQLLAAQAGPWRVQLVLDDDTVIYSYPFEFVP